MSDARPGAAPEADPENPAPTKATSRPGGEPWNAAPYPVTPKPEAWRMAIGAVRLLLIALWTLVMFLLHKAVAFLQRRAFPGLRRLRVGIEGLWGRVTARLLGLKIVRVGRPMTEGGALVANHSSWTDILALMGAAPVTFVSKAEVQGWPGIGALAAAAETLFIERRRSQAKAQEREMAARILGGQKLLFFPEGTSTDALRVIPFKTTLFATFYSEELRETVKVQPVSVVYMPKAGGGRPRVLYGWWGDMDLGPHIWTLLTRSFGGRVEVVFHAPVKASDFKGRKELAAHCDAEVRRGVEGRLGPPPAEIPQPAGG